MSHEQPERPPAVGDAQAAENSGKGARGQGHSRPADRARTPSADRGRPRDAGRQRTGAQPDRSDRSAQRHGRLEEQPRRTPRPVHEDPRRSARRLAVSEDIDPRDLDPALRSELRSLSKDTADRVARHLLAAGAALDDSDDDVALAHAHAARALAGRVAGVREAVGVVAYRCGAWQEALAEIRAGVRMSGRVDLLPLQADCERALGRPEQALALGGSAAGARLDAEGRVELAIVLAGARRDMGQFDAAVLLLQGQDLSRAPVRLWSARLWYALADNLLAAGRAEQARQWFTAVVQVDDGETDAYDRLAELD